MEFLTEGEPARGVATEVWPGIRRLVARNPGAMTYRGTNTYLIEGAEGVWVLDPGPEDARHVGEMVEAAGGRLAGILLSHTHGDHLGALAGLKAATGARVCAFHAPAVAGFVPDVGLRDGERVGEWEALHTPGHAADHLCFAGPGGVVFSGDHVMGWSSSVVSPPGGNMRQYFSSLERLLGREDTVYLPGHGPAVRAPKAFAAGLMAHRQAREAAILAALGPEPRTAAGLVAELYAGVDRGLWAAAERNVGAHLGKLEEEGRVRETGKGWLQV